MTARFDATEGLPKKRDGGVFKIEVIIGQTVRTDAENRYFFGGFVTSFAMAVDPNAPLGGETMLGNNSRLPEVVYVPASVDVRYRLWRAGPILLAHPDERR